MKTVKLILLVTAVVLLTAVRGFTQITADEALSQFVAAGMAYKDGRYDEAVTRYHSVIDGGRESGALYYNLGNSYFKKGKTGKAVLNFERALKFIPRDSDLNFNYRYVRSQIELYGQDGKEGFIGRMIKGHIRFYTVDEMALILFGIGFLIGAIFLFSLYLNWPRPATNAVLAVLAAAFIVYAAGLTAKTSRAKDMAVIMASSESTFEPRADSTVHFKLSEGMKVKILKSEGTWIKIQRPDGKAGWVDKEVVERIS